ncbi:Uncharacterised protein [Actinobacillus pleuropneumoniae]|nr:Uncharacterised protein [Actinobacillus pleuropneumoniae]
MRKSWWSSVWPPVAAVLFFLTVWQAAVSVFDIEPYILPAPTAIGHEAATGASGLFQHTLATLQLTLVGFMIGTAIGLVISLACIWCPFSKQPFIRFLFLARTCRRSPSPRSL